MNYAKTAFTQAIQKLQEKYGSRANYARMERINEREGLAEQEIDFITDRDGFYLSSIGENGYPYIQFRGGPRGFLKVLDSTTLAFLDFRGNMQFISTGNISLNKKVSLFLMDYALRTRLKIYAEAEVFDIHDNPALAEALDIGDYKAKPERIIVFHIKAFDWNCPQHIKPKYNIEEVQEAFEAQQTYIEQLEEEIKRLKLTEK
jgi:uncharacterized protein